MRIGFDAKRAFYNSSGLGNYSRDLIKIVCEYAAEHEYLAFKHSNKPGRFPFNHPRLKTILPVKSIYKTFGGYWRRRGISKEIAQYKLDIFHGLSQELPIGIEKSGVKTVVTIHDCIFLRFPELFDISYRYIFKKKYAHAIQIADRIIAISEQTRQDILHYFDVDKNKIDLVYQGCSPQFYEAASSDKKEAVKQKYQLPEQYILSVGTIEERKNVLSVFKALHEGNILVPFVVVGRETKYTQKVKEYVKAYNLEDRALFLHSVSFDELPALYQMASLFAYPSLFEGFGIPILEALNSGTPVVTSKGSCFPEVGGTAAKYVAYGNTPEMISTLQEVLNSETLQQEMRTEGLKQALKFREAEIAKNLNAVYQKAVQ